LTEFGQGIPHPRGYGSFPRRIREYTLNRDVVDLGATIRSMTHMPAAVYRMRDRGMIREGAFADILVFDLEKVNDPATFGNPHNLAEGMVHVIVNGGFAIHDGEFTETLHGVVLDR